jgi:hypothetical protein
LSFIPHKNAHRWLAGYLTHVARGFSRRRERGPTHLLLAICDHYEPLWGGAPLARGSERVRRWVEGYPRLASDFRDADGRPPRHTFFFPGEQYQPEYLDALGRLVGAGLGEVEVHLHHDGDDEKKLTDDLERTLRDYSEHGHLSRDGGGRLRYAFIHGNWCLANSRRDGRWCGVDSELDVLFRTGCYADFTFPSAPDESQPPIVNQIYWPTGDPKRARSHEKGVRARVGTLMRDRILLIQGPLAIARRGRGWSPRLEASALTANDPPTGRRFETWISQRIQVEGRPDWIFVKVHTHGAPEAQADSLLGEAGRAFHRALADGFNDGERFVLHYVTAREMFNIAVAGMRGERGNPAEFRDHALPPPPRAA